MREFQRAPIGESKLLVVVTVVTGQAGQRAVLHRQAKMKFGQLIAAQAAGDAEVLAAHGRPVVTLTLTDPQVEVLSLFEAAQ